MLDPTSRAGAAGEKSVVNQISGLQHQARALDPTIRVTASWDVSMYCVGTVHLWGGPR